MNFFPPARPSRAKKNPAPKIIRRFSCLLLALGSPLLALGSAPTTEPADLGANLSYLRVYSLADTAPILRATLAANRALVLDLRYTTLGAESDGALRTALAQHPAEPPLFVLISPATPASVLAALNETSGPLVTLGLADVKSAPKIVVKTDAAADRRAYDALDSGTPIEALISGKIEKERYDEATLVEEFKNGNPDPAPPPAPDPTVPKAADAAQKTPPLIDRVLQRAVHLHRAMLALRR